MYNANIRIATINRVMRADFTLSNGLTLPEGSRFCVPASQVSLDPEIWEDPYKFDGFRYEALRSQKPENISQMQFPTPTTHSLHFGTGMSCRLLCSVVSMTISSDKS